MIKKIVFNIPTSSGNVNLYRMQFSTKVDGEWAIYDIGKFIGEIDNGVEFENITVEYLNYGGSTIIAGLKGPFLFTGNFQLTYGDGPLVITFKEGLRVLSGIYYGFYYAVPTNMIIYDENDVVLFEGSGFSKMSMAGANYATHFFATKDLEIMRVYPKNTLGTIETNDNTQVKNIYQIESIIPSQVTPENTDIRYLLSFDGRNTYKTYKDGSWNVVDTSNIMNEGMTKDEIIALTPNDFDTGMTTDRTLDILIGMTTQNEYSTPSISEVKVLYLRIV